MTDIEIYCFSTTTMVTRTRPSVRYTYIACFVTLDLQISMCLIDHFIVLCPSSLVHSSIRDTYVSALTDTEIPLRCISAVYPRSPFSACTQLNGTIS